MWKQLVKALKLATSGSDARATFYIYDVQTPEGDRHIVSLFPGAFESGLAAECIVGEYTRLPQDGERATDVNFLPNPMFVKLLHEVIARHAPQLPGLRAEARRQHEGWVYVLDARTTTPEGHVPPHDIIGGFEVQGGEVVSNSYRSNAKHRLLSAEGIFRLEQELHERLMERINDAQKLHSPT